MHNIIDWYHYMLKWHNDMKKYHCKTALTFAWKSAKQNVIQIRYIKSVNQYIKVNFLKTFYLFATTASKLIL